MRVPQMHRPKEKRELTNRNLSKSTKKIYTDIHLIYINTHFQTNKYGGSPATLIVVTCCEHAMDNLAVTLNIMLSSVR